MEKRLEELLERMKAVTAQLATITEKVEHMAELEECRHRARGGVKAPEVHEVKILPEYYEAVLSGDKRFELRKDDRGYCVGDTLRLREWASLEGGYTMRQMDKQIIYVLRADRCDGLKPGWCILGIR